MRCVAHVHSTHSDGTATVAELRAFVRATGAQVLLLTDHDTLGAREAGEDGWGEDVLVVCGQEVSPRGGHLLVFGTDDVIAHGSSETEILDAVGEAGGIAYAAHPFSSGSAMSTRIGRPHGWTVFHHPALTGVEVWSLTTDVAESWRTPWAAVRALADPLQTALAGPPAGALERWDALNTGRERPLAALGGLDGHAPGVRLGGRVLSPLPHGRWMGLVETVLTLSAPLTGTASDDGLVLDALRAGRTAVAVPPLGDPLASAPPTRSVPVGRFVREEWWRDGSLWRLGSPVSPR